MKTIIENLESKDIQPISNNTNKYDYLNSDFNQIETLFESEDVTALAINDTPFTIVEDKTGITITMGEFAIEKNIEDIQTAISKAQTINWDKILKVIEIATKYFKEEHHAKI